MSLIYVILIIFISTRDMFFCRVFCCLGFIFIKWNKVEELVGSWTTVILAIKQY